MPIKKPIAEEIKLEALVDSDRGEKPSVIVRKHGTTIDQLDKWKEERDRANSEGASQKTNYEEELEAADRLLGKTLRDIERLKRELEKLRRRQRKPRG